MEVNFMGAVHATAAALTSLRQTRGLIVAISSLQGLIGFPRATAYAATKHAMQGFFDCLRIDLKGDVGVLVVSPGPVATAIHQRDAAPSKTISDEKVVRRSMSAAHCAKLICRAIERRQRNLVMTWEGRLAASLYPFFPGFVDKQVVKATKRFYEG
jgi:short-subunit dehydrogenase